MRLPILVIAFAVAALAQAAPQPPTFRLGDVATPLEYNATLAIDPRQPEFSGEVKIAIRINRATPVLWLNATKLTIESAAFEQGRRKIAVNVVPGGEDYVGFEAHGGEFAPGIALATIRYRGPLEPLSTRGLFRQQDRGEWYVVSQFEAFDARRAFPCFDEPGWKTPWRVTIDAPSRDVAVSNTPETRASAAPGRSGWTRHEFGQTKPLPSYLIAMAVGPFEVVDGGSAGANKTKLRYLTQKGRAEEANWAREVTPQLLESLEDYFGMPYPFDKLDSVSIPQTTGFGAMENVGMITYASGLILATPRDDTAPFKRRYASIAAHEIAHMWFGDLVTLAWWDDTWLNEAFATWMAGKIVNRLKPEWDAGYTAGRSRKYALEVDRLASARQVRNPVLEKGDIWAAFDSITYNKGAAVLSTFETWFGPERFREGVRTFLKRHAYGTATAEDFARALGEAAGRGPEALAVFRAFIEQPGVPLLDIALDCTKAPSVDIRQQRLRPAGSSAPELRWTTPACFRGAAGTQCADIKSETQRVPLKDSSCPAWLMANPGGRNYYVPPHALAPPPQPRATVLPFAADRGDAALRTEARELALAWLANRDAVPATMIRPVLNTAARFADAALYDRLREQTIKTADLRERAYLIYALAKTREPGLRDRTLAFTLDKELSGRDARDLLEDALDDQTNRRPAFDFMRANYDALVAKLPEHTMARLMEPMGDFCTREERDAFVSFFKDRAPAILGGPRHYRQAPQRIDLRIPARHHS